MRRLGITGGIGSGKSFVCSVLREAFGLPVYDCDTEAKRLINAEPGIRARLTELAGASVYNPDGTLDRDALATYLFASDAHTAGVNAIVHPFVRRDFRQWCARQGAETVCMESAILYESGFDGEVDEVVFVDAPEETRLARTTQRSGGTRAEVAARMARQRTAEARSKAHHIIYNGEDTTKETIANQIKERILYA